MNRIWRIAALIAALTIAGKASAAEVIHSFDSDVQVAKDGELTVTETLRVRAEGDAMRHGIYRDFPLTFRDAGGSLREVTFSIIAVRRDGHLEPYHTERTNGVLRIYAGDKDTRIQPGEYTYMFEYRTGRQVRFFDARPELNWNVTGNFWRFPIEAATYHLHLVDGAAPLRWTAFTGRVGARGTDWRGDIGGDGTLTVSTTRRLAPGEGLTVVAALPTTAVDPPSAETLLWYRLFDNRQWIIGGIGFLTIFIYYFAAWEAFGRDPKGGLIIPLFHPPDGISPALANYIHKWGLTREKWRAFTAASLSLAVRGLISLDRSGGGLTLKATGNNPAGAAPLSAEERAIVTKLAVTGGTIVIDRAHSTTVADLATKFTSAVVTLNRNRFFRRNLGYVIFGLMMTAAVIAAIVAFGGLQDTDISILALFGFGGIFGGMFLLPILQALVGQGPKVGILVGLGDFFLDRRDLLLARGQRCRLGAARRTARRPANGHRVRRGLSVFLRPDHGIRGAQWHLSLFDEGANRTRPQGDGSARRLAALSRNRGIRPAQLQRRARDHRGPLRGAAGLRGGARCGKAVVARLQIGVAAGAS